MPTEGDVVPPSWRKPGSTQCFWLPLPAFWALLHPPAQPGRHFGTFTPLTDTGNGSLSSQDTSSS